LAKDYEVVLHIGKGMALSSKNLRAKYEVLGVPSFVMPKMTLERNPLQNAQINAISNKI
jgi:hypothetical protein